MWRFQIGHMSGTYMYTSGKKKQCMFKIAGKIDECEENAKIIITFVYFNIFAEKLPKFVMKQSCVSRMG